MLSLFRPRRWQGNLLGAMAALLLFPSALQAFIMPLTIKGADAPARLEFGLSYAELAPDWELLPWPQEESSLSLLPAEILSAKEIELFAQPFLTRFVFEQPRDKGRLIGLHLVHWEKGARNESVLAGFLAALQETLGEGEKYFREENDWRLSSWHWPGVSFTCRQDEAGQTWYLSARPSSPPEPDFLPQLPLGQTMIQLEPLLQPYFEPGMPWPARPLRQNQPGLSKNGIALSRALFLFSGYRPQDAMIGILLIFPSLPGSSWQEAALEDLREEFSLQYGPCRTNAPDLCLWETQGGSLRLSRQTEGSWRLLGISSAAPPDFPDPPPELLPPGERGIDGWDKFPWHMPLAAALNLCPPGAQTGRLAYGESQRFIFSQASLNNMEHGLRLAFDSQGLYEIILSYDYQAREGEEQAMLAGLDRDYGAFDWRHDDDDEQIFYWSRARGCLKLINFKTSGRGWRLVFTRR
jgi:hypothetical protein